MSCRQVHCLSGSVYGISLRLGVYENQPNHDGESDLLHTSGCGDRLYESVMPGLQSTSPVELGGGSGYYRVCDRNPIVSLEHIWLSGVKWEYVLLDDVSVVGVGMFERRIRIVFGAIRIFVSSIELLSIVSPDPDSSVSFVSFKYFIVKVC